MIDKNKQFTGDRILPAKFVKKAHAWVVTVFKNNNQNQIFFPTREEADKFIKENK
jgi:hypothetical protein